MTLESKSAAWGNVVLFFKRCRLRAVAVRAIPTAGQFRASTIQTAAIATTTTPIISSVLLLVCVFALFAALRETNLEETRACAGSERVPDTEANTEDGGQRLQALMKVSELSGGERERQTD